MVGANHIHCAWTNGTTPHKKRSRAKRAIERPYMPPYVDREEIAYRLRVSINTVDNWLKAHLLPSPVLIFGGMQRWRWSDIEDAIERLNLLAGDNGPSATSESDRFLEAIRRGAPAHE